MKHEHFNSIRISFADSVSAKHPFNEHLHAHSLLQLFTYYIQQQACERINDELIKENPKNSTQSFSDIIHQLKQIRSQTIVSEKFKI